jgi:DNA-binding MarR family transcriptional regulator
MAFSTSPGADPAVSSAATLTRMRAIVRTVQGLLAANATDAGLNQSDFQALVRVVDADGLTGADIGRMLGMTSSSTTELADRLETAGMINRTRSPSDRRLVILKPTARGRRLVQRALAPALTAVAEVLEDLNEHELALVDQFLDRVHERLASLSDR